MKISLTFLALLCCSSGAFTAAPRPFVSKKLHYEMSSSTSLMNTYDDWKSDGIVDQIPLDEESVRMCLDELVSSNYGMTMFGVHDAPGKKHTHIKM
jgi:hypothetical protein